MGIPNQDPKGGDCLNILFYLTPKANCELLYDDESIREALERLELSGFSALPIVNKENGLYRGTLTEGDLLWAMKNLCNMDLKEAETHNIMEITHSRDNTPVSISTEGNELMRKVLVQGSRSKANRNRRRPVPVCYLPAWPPCVERSFLIHAKTDR